MVESKQKTGTAKPYLTHGAAGANPHSMTNKAVHTNILKAPEPKPNRGNSRSRSPRGKPTGFVNLEKAGKKVKLDAHMEVHMRDDRKKKPNPKKLEKSMSLQVREYLA